MSPKLAEYIAGLNEYYDAIALPDGLWADGRLDPINKRLDAIWPKLSGQERRAVQQYMQKRYDKMLTSEGEKAVAKLPMTATECKVALQGAGVSPEMLAQAEAAGIPWAGLWAAIQKASAAGFTTAALFQFALDVWALFKGQPPTPQV